MSMREVRLLGILLREGANVISLQQGPITYYQFSILQPFPELVHGVFSRQGGVSPAPYASLNIAAHPNGENDRQENATRNRALILDTLGLSQKPCLNLWQIHSARALVFRIADLPLWRTDWPSLSYYDLASWTTQIPHKADAIITQEHGFTLAMGFADCTPLLFYDPVQQIIASTHAGWRGTARGIALETIVQMESLGARREDILVGIGPAIGSCCYEVSEDLYEHFMGTRVFDEEPTRPAYQQIVRETAQFSRRNARLYLSPAASSEQQLLAFGLQARQIENANLCTSCHVEQFFSHRREHGRTGRFASIIALKA